MIEKTLIEQIPGRAFWNEKPALQCQFCLPANAGPAEQLNELRKISEEMRASWTGEFPERVEVLENIRLEDIELEAILKTEWKPLQSVSDFMVPIGLDYATHEPKSAHLLQETPYFLVIGPQGSGDQEALKAFILSMALQFSPSDLKLHLIGLRENGIETLEGLPHVQELIHTEEEISNLVHSFEALVTERKSGNTLRLGKLITPVHLIIIDDYSSLAKNIEPKLLERLEFDFREPRANVRDRIDYSYYDHDGQ